MKAFLIWLPFIVLVALTAYLGRNMLISHSAIAADLPMVGQKAPLLNLPPLDEKSTPLINADITGKAKLVNFFASWCGPCKEENDVLLDLQKRGAVIEGVALQDAPQALWSYLGGRGNPYDKIGMDNSGATAIDWGVRGIPETFLIDSKGMILVRHVGPLSDSDADDLMKKLKAAE